MIHMNMLSELNDWQALLHHQQEIAHLHMRHMFQSDPGRFPRYTKQCGEILLDYSRNRINDQTLRLFANLARAVNLKQKIDALFSGENINTTEKRPALHTALRDQNHSPIYVKGENIAPLISATKMRMHTLCQRIHDKSWLGVSGKPLKHIVNIGIGGSYLGPMMCTNALSQFNCAGLNFHFISTVDKANLDEVIQKIDLETTLFIISSKTFTTIETMTNAQSILALLKSRLGGDALKQHLIAITACEEKALAFGICKDNIFPMWDWVGGRYSIWSAIGLPLLLLLGSKQYEAFLHGAFLMDEHFKEQPATQNIPVLIAMLGIWYMNFFGSHIKAIVPYSHRLRYFVPYLQQAEMESLGKSVCLNGELATYATGTVIFGEEGCNGQHAYHQLLLQGQHLIPVDFILIGQESGFKATRANIHQQILIASGLSQAQALMRGKTEAEAYQELLQTNCSDEEARALAPHRTIPGNRPSNILFLQRLTPHNLGALIALYEHKIFVQGVIWDINSFDQWGVELGKQLLPTILQSLQQEPENGSSLKDIDSATVGLINHFNALQEKTILEEA